MQGQPWHWATFQNARAHTHAHRGRRRPTEEGEALETATREDEAEEASVEGKATAAAAKVAADAIAATIQRRFDSCASEREDGLHSLLTSALARQSKTFTLCFALPSPSDKAFQRMDELRSGWMISSLLPDHKTKALFIRALRSVFDGFPQIAELDGECLQVVERLSFL
jgi:hypothetical protein